MDGRKGLVRANFVEKLRVNRFFNFMPQFRISFSFSYDQDIKITVSVDYLLPEDFHPWGILIWKTSFEEDNREDVEEYNGDFSRGVPPTQHLILEHQMNLTPLDL